MRRSLDSRTAGHAKLRGRVGPRRSVRGLALLSAAAALAVVLVPLGTAKPPSSDIKHWSVCLQYAGAPLCSTSGVPTNLPGGTNPSLTLTVKNASDSNQTLGSVNFDGPFDAGGNPVTTISNPQYVPGTGSGTQTFGTNTSNEIQLRNLNLAPNTSVSVTFTVDNTPCSGTLYWNPYAKQSNTFLGTGNDFQTPVSTGLPSSVQSCYHIAFVNQPARTGVGQKISDADYSTGNPIQVGLYDKNDNLVNLPSCPLTDCTITMTRSPILGTFGGTGQQALAYDSSAGGLVASFGDLSIGGLTTLPQAFTLTATGASGAGVGTATSNPFNVTSYTDCTLQVNGCTTDPLLLSGGSTFTQSQTSSTDFVFMGVDTLNLDPTNLPAGCQSLKILKGTSPIVVTDQRTDLSGDLYVTYGVKQSDITKLYGNNQGQQFIPICAGARRIDIDPNTGKTFPVPCTEDYRGHSQAGTGWWGKELSADGKFDGNLKQAVCDPTTGYFVGILGSFQDYTNSNKALVIDPSWSPTTTSWTTQTISGTNFRLFTSRFPSSSGPVAPYSGTNTGDTFFNSIPWDGWKFT